MRTEELRDDARDYAAEAAGAAQRSVDRMSEYAESARKRMGKGARELAERQSEAVGYARDTVGSYPLSSVVLAVLVGLVLGWLIRR